MTFLGYPYLGRYTTFRMILINFYFLLNDTGTLLSDRPSGVPVEGFVFFYAIRSIFLNIN